MNDELLDQITEFNDLLTDAMNRSGVFYTVRHDMDEWARRMETAPQIMMINPTFDPRHSDQTRSFWIDIHDRVGEPMAMIANRLIETDDYVAMMANGTAWYDRPGPWPVMTLRLPPGPEIAGRIHSRGGLYAYPQYRKRGLAYAATRLMRSLSLVGRIDWTVSQTNASGVAKNLPIEVFGYTRCNLIFSKAVLPYFSQPTDLYFVSVSHSEMAAQLGGDIEWLRMRRDQDLARIAETWRAIQRQEQPVEAARLATVA